MDSRLYNKKITCPVCNAQIEITKVKLKACKPILRDTDFCASYENLNPLFYEIWVCGNCGYAAQDEKFETISAKDSKLVRSAIANHWVKRNFMGEKTVENAIEAFKLAIVTAKARNAKSSELARYCIRIAWFYRIRKDSREMDYMRFARKCYEDAYEKERFPVDKMDEFTCLYMIAELCRRTGEYEASIKWFSRLISSPMARSKPVLIDMARDQYQLAKDQMKELTDFSTSGVDGINGNDDIESGESGS